MPQQPAAPKRVCTAVLNWNQPALTLDCVRHLLATQPAAGHTVLVVDNGSKPANLAALQDGLPAGVRLVRSGRNLGYAGGMNLGVRHALAAGAEYVWLLNNDAFPEPGCLAALAAAMAADPRLGAVTPLLYGRDGVEQHAGAEITWVTAESHTRRAAELTAPADQAAVWLTGTAPLVRAAALRAAGGFDERYFAYWEDVDLCLRLRRVGYRLRAEPAARCLHVGSASTGAGGGDTPFSVYMMTRNGYRFFAAHPDRRGRVLRLTAFANRVLGQAADEYRAGKVRLAEARVSGTWAAVRREGGPPAGFGAAGPAVRLAARGLARVPWRVRRWLDLAVARAVR